MHMCTYVNTQIYFFKFRKFCLDAKQIFKVSDHNQVFHFGVYVHICRYVIKYLFIQIPRKLIQNKMLLAQILRTYVHTYKTSKKSDMTNT